MNKNRTALLIACVVALGTGLLTLNFLSSTRQAAQNAPQRTYIIAAQDIPARVIVTEAMLRATTRASSDVDPDALSTAKNVIGQYSLITIPAGSTITASKVGRPTQLPLSVTLRPGFRAVSIPVDRVKGVAGLVQPGDRVDVIAIPPKSGNQTPLAVTFLRGVQVLSIGTAMENPQASPAPNDTNTTATLAVTPTQADILATADVNTTLRLALRSPQESIKSYPIEALHFTTSEGSTVAAAAPEPSAAQLAAQFALTAQMMQRPPASKMQFAPRVTIASHGVQLIDGDHAVSSFEGP